MGGRRRILSNSYSNLDCEDSRKKDSYLPGIAASRDESDWRRMDSPSSTLKSFQPVHTYLAVRTHHSLHSTHSIAPGRSEEGARHNDDKPVLRRPPQGTRC